MSEVTSNSPTGTPVWIELGIPDLERAMGFYRALFGWEFQVGPAEMMSYTVCTMRGLPVAGIMPNPDPDATGFWWQVYLAADDADGTAKRVLDAGGEIVRPAHDMDQGRMAIVKDSVGGQFGLWQGRGMVGARVVNEPGALVWNELVTADGGAAREFYTTVFSYTLEDLAPDYGMLRLPDGHEIGGIYHPATAGPAAWVTYFQVAGTEAAVDRATAAGGTPRGEVIDSPYGRWAALRDPFGAEFRVITPPENPPG